MSPDVTMCRGTNCPYKESCFRYTSKPSDYQWFFKTPPFTKDSCEMYWGDLQSEIWKQLKDIVK